MLGSQSGFQKQVKELAPEAKGTHSFIHRYALASKTLPAQLKDVLNSVVKIVNFIKQEVSANASSNNFARIRTQHTKRCFSTQLFAGSPKGTFLIAFMR